MEHQQQDMETFWRPALDGMALEVQRKEALRIAQIKARILRGSANHVVEAVPPAMQDTGSPSAEALQAASLAGGGSLAVRRTDASAGPGNAS